MHHVFQKFTITDRPPKSPRLTFWPSIVFRSNAGDRSPSSRLVVVSDLGSPPTWVASTTENATTRTAAASAIARAGCLTPAPLPSPLELPVHHDASRQSALGS